MRKKLKKLMTIFTACMLTTSAAAYAVACSGTFRHPSGIPSGNAVSNGGFVVEVGDYYYFINGVENYQSDNTFGSPVKGALLRIQKNLLAENKAETVIPSLLTAGDYTSGFYIYGDRVYYATPNNVKNTSGNIETDYLDFKSAKLDGSDICDYFNVPSNTTPYRFVEVGGTVYVMYTEDSSIISYNTASKSATTLAENVGESFFNSSDKEDSYIYYTMSVTLDIDIPDGSSERPYNQIYRVRADAAECPYEELRNYQWNQTYLDENNGKAPYLNLGELVLDGIGSIYQENPTIFSHHLKNTSPLTTAGYTYDLQSYANGGIYFTRKDLTTTGTVGEDGWLYYLSSEKLTSGWNSVSGNAKSNLDVVAQPSDLSNANDSALFYLENGTHHYLYLNSSNLLRADVDKSGVATVTRIAQGIGSATLSLLDDSDPVYHYVYYTLSGGGGNQIWRAVYNGTEENYKSLGYEANEPYRPIQILNLEHAKSWYPFEMIGTRLFFADAETIGSTSYNYVAYADLANADGSLMNNSQLKEYKEKMDEVVGSEGYLSQLIDDGNNKLSTALKYHYYTGKTEQFFENIEEAERETGKENTLYSEDDVKAFDEYTKANHDSRSDYIHSIGIRSDADEQTYTSYWKNTLEHYTAPTEEESGGLPVWAWILIALAILIVVGGAVAAVILILRARKTDLSTAEEKMFVDTTDDKDVDVYADLNSSEETSEVEDQTDQSAPEKASETDNTKNDENGEEASEKVEGEESDENRPFDSDEPKA